MIVMPCIQGVRGSSKGTVLNLSDLELHELTNDSSGSLRVLGRPAKVLTTVGFEPTPFRNSALSCRLRPLGHIVMVTSCKVVILQLICTVSLRIIGQECMEGRRSRRLSGSESLRV